MEKQKKFVDVRPAALVKFGVRSAVTGEKIEIAKRKKC